MYTVFKILIYLYKMWNYPFHIHHPYLAGSLKDDSSFAWMWKTLNNVNNELLQERKLHTPIKNILFPLFYLVIEKKSNVLDGSFYFAVSDGDVIFRRELFTLNSIETIYCDCSENKFRKIVRNILWERNPWQDKRVDMLNSWASNVLHYTDYTDLVRNWLKFG